MEETLETLQATQGQSVDELEKQLKESEEILASMDRNYKTELLQNLTTVLLSADDDGNMKLEDDDIDKLIHDLEGIHGIQLKEEKLRTIIDENGRSLPALMEVAKRLLNDSIPEDENLFSFIESK